MKNEIEKLEESFQNILNSPLSSYFNISSKSLKNNRESYIYDKFNKYRVFSDNKGQELLFGTKKYKGAEHIIINIDKERFFSDESNDINCLELFKNGVIFTEGEFYVF